jgi:hypothetical protein
MWTIIPYFMRQPAEKIRHFLVKHRVLSASVHD